MANFIRHFDKILENLEVTGKKVRHFDNDPETIAVRESCYYNRALSHASLCPSEKI